MSKLTDGKLKEMGFTKYMVGDLTYFLHQEEDVKLEKIHCGYLNPLLIILLIILTKK